jgi:acyl-[acyl carrier protein]--UDP-N-acetylglucosamine O-acyltransferase
MALIHSTAIVDSNAQLASDVEVGRTPSWGRM